MVFHNQYFYTDRISSIRKAPSQHIVGLGYLDKVVVQVGRVVRIPPEQGTLNVHAWDVAHVPAPRDAGLRLALCIVWDG